MAIYGRQIDTLIHCRDSFPIVICYYEKEVETVMVRNHTNININHILKSLNKNKKTPGNIAFKFQVLVWTGTQYGVFNWLMVSQTLLIMEICVSVVVMSFVFIL